MVDMSDPLARLFHEDLIVIDGPALTRPPLGTMPEVKALIDELGRRSGLAQGLKGPNGAVAPVTVSAKLAASQERLYLLAHGQQPRQLIGLLKVGRKNLFHYSTQGKVTELKDQLSVLDFYVHEAWQRGGVGHALFAAMLEHEECGAVQFAYDRPSPKLIGFLRKHYNLANFVPQQNNYVIFEEFFAKRPVVAASAYDSVANRPLTARNRRFR